MSKVSVFLARAVTVTIGAIEHKLVAGRQFVDKEVAEHWMVRAQATDAPVAASDPQVADLTTQNEALQAQVVTLNAKVAELTLAAETQASANDAIVSGLTSQVAAANAKVAELQSVIDLSAAPATDAKVAKAK